MSKPKPINPPTPLWKVLEEEFIALGGTLPKPYCTKRDAALAQIAGNDDEHQTQQNRALLTDLYQCFHDRAKAGQKRTALCFSGGGIRSATFNLGVLQRLVEIDLLPKFDYLSTVSGGGYLGSWLSGWIHHDPDGVKGVIQRLKSTTPGATDPEPAPLRHLRKFSRYLSPTLGLFSPDTWTLATIYLRNLMLNWLVLIPLLVALLMIPRLCVAVVALDPWLRGEPFLGMSPNFLMGLLLLVGMGLAVWTFAYAGLHQPSARKARALRAGKDLSLAPPSRGAEGQIHFLKWCWTPMMISAVCLSAFWAWVGADNPMMFNWTHFVAFGVCLGVVGWTVFATSDGELSKLCELPCVIMAGVAFGLSLFGSAHLMEAIMPYRPQPEHIEPLLGEFYARYVLLGLPLIICSFSLGGTLYVGFVSRLRSTHDEDREWWARAGAWLLMAVVGWLTVAGVVLYGPGLILLGGHWVSVTAASLGGVTGIVTLWLGNSAATPANRAPREGQGRTQKIKSYLMALAAPIAIAVLIIGLSLAAGVVLFMTWAYFASPDAMMALFPEIMGEGGSFWSGDPAGAYFRMLYVPAPLLVLGWMVVLAGFGMLMSRIIDLNKFSMHGMYRDRIVRAYLGASRAESRRPDPFTGFDPDDHIDMHKLRAEVVRREDLLERDDFLHHLRDAAKRKNHHSHSPADPVSEYLVRRVQPSTREALAALDKRRDRAVTALLDDLAALIVEDDFAKSPAFSVGFAGNGALASLDPERLAQDVPLRNRLLLDAAYPLGIRPLSTDRVSSIRPLHVINIALNLVNTDDPTWQERKAESLTVSALHSGSGRLGYRSSLRYGGDYGIGLGTAVTISGAAVSPNMGYHSSKPIAFLMTLFNVRLGWWLGNPGAHGNDTFHRAFPVFSVTPLAAEALGLSDARHRYVYLSDGGHFENLGLYEMVRRRCHVIVLGDAGRDPGCTFEDLGNAVRKIRIDMGVPITFRGSIAIRARDAADAKTAGRYCAIGEIDYKAIDGPGAENGVLLYVKPAFYGAEPADVYNYAKGCEDFPHESTADQFFSESQFESYRALGYHTLQQIWGKPGAAEGLECLVERALDYLELNDDGAACDEPEATEAGLGSAEVREHLDAASQAGPGR
jgi:hypothetical protein